MALSLKTYTIERSGEALFRVAGEFHCGPKSSLVSVPGKGMAVPVRYTVTLQCAPKLDERGFLVDQANVGKYIEALGMIESYTLSCERLARYTAERLITKIERDVPTCQLQSVTLRFSPAPFMAGITVAYGA